MTDTFTIPADALENLPGEEGANDDFQIRQNYRRAQRTTPQQAVQDRDLSRETGVPVDVLDTQRERVQGMSEDEQFMESLRGRPATRQFYSDPQNTAIGRGAAPALASLESSFGVASSGSLSAALDAAGVPEDQRLTGIPGAIGEAAFSVVAPIAGFFQSGIENEGSSFIRGGVEAGSLVARGGIRVLEIQSRIQREAYAKGLRVLGASELATELEAGQLPWWLNIPAGIARNEGRDLVAFMERVEAQFQAKDPERFSNQVAAGLGQLTAQVTMTLLTGGLASTGFLVGQGVGIVDRDQEQQEADRENLFGLPQQLADDIAALGGGAVTGITERYGIDLLLNRIPAQQRYAVLRMIFSGGSEAAQEIVEGIGHNLIAAGLYDTDREILNIDQLAEEGKVAFVVGTIAGGFTGRGRRHSGPAAQKQAFDQINAEAVAAQEQVGDPDTAAAHRREVTRAAGVTEIRIPATQVLNYANQAEQGQAAVIAQLGVGDQMAAALADDIDVVISGDAYATYILAQDAYDFLAPHIRYTSDGLTAAEAAERVRDNGEEITAQLDEEIERMTEVLNLADLTETERTDTRQALALNNRLRAVVTEFMEGDDAAATEILANAQKSRDVGQALDELVEETEARNRDIGAEIREARAAQIDSELSDLDSQLNTLNAEIELAEVEGRATTRLRNQFDRLVEQEQKLQGEQDALLAANLIERAQASATEAVNLAQNFQFNEAEQVLERAEAERARGDKLQAEADDRLGVTGQVVAQVKPSQKVLTKAQKLKALNVRTNTEAVRAARRGFNEGAKAAKANIKDAQKIFRQVINNAFPKVSEEAGINKQIAKELKQDREQFLARVAQIDSVEKLERQLPKLREDILKAIDKRRKRVLLARLKKVINKKVVFRDRSGVLRGRIGPETIRVMQTLQDAMRMKQGEALTNLTLLRGGAVDIPDVGGDLLMQMLALKAEPDSVSATDIENLLIDINDLVTEGAAIARNNALVRAARIEAQRERLLEAVGEVPESGPVTDDGNVLKRLFVNGGLGWSGAWWNKLGFIMTTSDRALADRVQRDLSLFEEARNHEEATKARTEGLFRILGKHLGLDPNEKGLRQKFFGGTKAERGIIEVMQQGALTDVAVAEGKKFEHSDGKWRVIKMKKNELIQLAAQLENDVVAEDSMSPESDAYTEEIIQAIKDEVNQDAQMRAIKDGLLEFYAEYFPDIDKAYTSYYGVHLPRIDRYVPVTRVTGQEDLNEFLRSTPMLGRTPSALKLRQRNSTVPLARADWASVVQRHISEMEYFIAYGEKARQINHVFNAEVKQRIEQVHGQSAVRIISKDIEWFTRKAVESNTAAEKAIAAFVRNFGIAQLALKPQIMIKQLASFPAFVEDVSVKDFLVGMTLYGKTFLSKSPARGVKFIRQHSRFFANRTLAIDNDFQDATASRTGNRFLNFGGRNPDVTNMMMLNVRVGDKGAISAGMYAHVYARLRQMGTTFDKATPAQLRAAFRTADQIASRTQQSRDPDQISHVQRGNVWFRIFSQFMSSANALTRAEVQAIIEVKRGRISKAEFGKRFVAYHFVIPNLIMLIANGFEWEPEDQIFASLLGTATGVLLLGDIIDLISRQLWNTVVTQADLDAEELDTFDLESRHPLELVNELKKAAEDMQRNGINFEEFIEHNKQLDAVLKAGSGLTSIPMSTFYNMARGVALAMEEPREGSALALGYSPYTVRKIVDD